MQENWILPFLVSIPLLTHGIPVGLGDVIASELQDDYYVCPNYRICGEKGLTYWNWLQGNISDPTHVDRTDGKELFDESYYSERVPLHERPVFSSQDLHGNALPDFDDPAYTYWYAASKIPGDGDENEEVPYKNIINTRDGVLITMEAFKEDDTAKTLPWSEIMYQVWQGSKAYDDERTKTKGLQGGTLSALKHSIQHHIVNVDTMRIMELMYSNSGYNPHRDWHWRTWTEAGTPYWFYALLGTDNCKGTVFLLTQHAAEAGKKEVAEIRTWWDDDYPHIWYGFSQAYIVFVPSRQDGANSVTTAGVKQSERLIFHAG